MTTVISNNNCLHMESFSNEELGVIVQLVDVNYLNKDKLNEAELLAIYNLFTDHELCTKQLVESMNHKGRSNLFCYNDVINLLEERRRSKPRIYSKAINSRISYLMQYPGLLNDLIQSFHLDGIKNLVGDVFSPHATFMAPDLRFVPAKMALPMFIEILLVAIPDIIVYAGNCRQLSPRLLTYQTVSCGTLVGNDPAEMLWNQCMYASALTYASVVRAKEAFQTLKNMGVLPVFSKVLNVVLILNEDCTHIERQINLLQYIEVTGGQNKSVYLE